MVVTDYAKLHCGEMHYGSSNEYNFKIENFEIASRLHHHQIHVQLPKIIL